MLSRKTLQLRRLRVMRRGSAVYDQAFHDGVNIIRGQNGSGKSTIADFIFFILGGEFDDWKDAAKQCDEVQAEIETTSGKLTLRRATDSKIAPVQVFFGEFDLAHSHALEGWQRFPIRRQSDSESFSQIMFRSIGIPEAQSDGASNITMHQILRLCYSDQRTPAARVFRYESFDTQAIREAVADIVCGISGYESYEISLELRALQKDLEQSSARLSSLLKVLPQDESLRTTLQIDAEISELTLEKEQLFLSIGSVDEAVGPDAIDGYIKGRKAAQEELQRVHDKLQQKEIAIGNIEYEMDEIREFQDYQSSLLQKLKGAEATLDAIGSIEFSHCPACGSSFHGDVQIGHCYVCRAPTDPEKERSRYHQIRMDLEIQARESRQLSDQKNSELEQLKREVRSINVIHKDLLSRYDLSYRKSAGPRDAYLAEKANRMGKIDGEIEYLRKSLDVAGEVERMERMKNELQGSIEKLKGKLDFHQSQAERRRARAMSEVSDIAVSLLHADFKRQEEFELAEKVEVNFFNDSMAVDGHMNFAESSNVFLKNAVILSLLLAAGIDEDFNHPQFVLFDNIEDKGMEPVRSHLFQRLIVERATELQVPFQVIFTTSMMNPELELDDYVIGPAYSKEFKTLQLATGSQRQTPSSSRWTHRASPEEDSDEEGYEAQ